MDIGFTAFVTASIYCAVITLFNVKDENKKYGVTTEILEKLLAHYIDEPYMTFDNTFKGINSQSLKEFLNDKLTLSYSSMDDYYKCSFRYYLDYILHVDKFEDSFATVHRNDFSRSVIEMFYRAIRLRGSLVNSNRL